VKENLFVPDDSILSLSLPISQHIEYKLLGGS